MNVQHESKEGSFTAEDFVFTDGGRMDLRLAYRTLGSLAPDEGNAVLLLHGTVGSGLQFLQPAFADALFGAGEPLDEREFFIILPDAIGHGGSSKPSDGMGREFPRYGYADVVEAQHRLVTEGLGLQRLRLVIGTSMGGMQTWMWGERYPDMMDALMPVATFRSASPDATFSGAGCSCRLPNSMSPGSPDRRRAAWAWPGYCSR